MFWWWKGTLYHCIWEGVPFSNSSRSLQRPESGKIKLLHRSHSVVVILTIHADVQQKMKQVTFLAIGPLTLYRQGFWGERVTAFWEIGTWLLHSFCVEGNPKSQQILMVPCMFLMLPCKSFCGAAWGGLQLQWFCVHAVQCLASWKCQKESQAYSSLGHGQMKADIASIVSLLIQQPRALQKHPRLLVTMRKRILGQSPTASCCWHMWRHAEYCTQTSHVQQLKLQTCSLWFSILISESLPLVTVVWWIVMARVSPIVALHPDMGDMGDMGAVSELGGSYQRCWREFQDRHWRQPKEPANPHASLHVPHASLYGFLRSCLTRVAASVILCACCAVRCEGELSERISSIQYLGTWEDESIYWPRALQKHPRLLVTMQKRIVGQSPAVCARGAMLNAQTSHVQQFKLCSLWFSILISESLPLLTVWRAVKARVSPNTISVSS